jgi:two-component system response regulator LytT
MDVLIIEDEDLAVCKLRKLLVDVDPFLVVKGVTGTIEDTVQWLRENEPPDLIFMDIELSDGQSFEIFNQVDISSGIIFTTSYDEYVLPAFQLHSIDYLLKPILKEDLLSSIEKFLNQNQRHGVPTSLPDRPFIDIENLIGQLKKIQAHHDQAFIDRFLARQGQKLLSVEAREIMYFYPDGSGSAFQNIAGKKFELDQPLYQLASTLDPKYFFNLDGQILINKAAIKKINQLPDTMSSLELKPAFEKEILLNDERATELKSWISH